MNKIEDIDVLISKFLSGEASPEEAILLEDWKNENDSNGLYYTSCEKLVGLTGKNESDQEPNIEMAWEKVKSKTDHKKNIRPLYNNFSLLRIAASIVLIVGLGITITYLFRNKNNREIAYETGNQMQEVKLPDGTDVIISPNSNVVMDKNFGSKNRTLHLKGSAYFSVKHSEELPFIIDAGNVYIKDIGTKFSIRSSVDTDTVYVNVDEGVVLLFDGLGSAIEIKATENALYIKSKKQLIGQSELTKQNVKLNFSNTRLEDVIIRLNELYRTTITLENATLKDCTITTQFNHEDLETVMGILTETLGLKYEKTSSGYLIKGQSCHP